jgi:hypothetical protein
LLIEFVRGQSGSRTLVEDCFFDRKDIVLLIDGLQQLIEGHIKEALSLRSSQELQTSLNQKWS